MAFGDQIYRQTKITMSKCHECETSFIKMPIVCHPVNAQNSPTEFILCNRKRNEWWLPMNHGSWP
ncbi:hypothetical protein GCM10009410_22990 [Shewanella ulleungensis]|uniref:Uncharacterized protein n=1 Tax=Shewanella ulleungensis TaxID=2282699 RepID=A0ABQ2QNS6_9GAMM|nr:hypothetical protein GCM10009410_22990 [Shewanella ulleungensis]